MAFFSMSRCACHQCSRHASEQKRFSLRWGCCVTFSPQHRQTVSEKAGEFCPRVRRTRYDAVSLTEGLHCVGGHPQYPCNLRAAFSCLPVANNVIPFSVCHENIPFRPIWSIQEKRPDCSGPNRVSSYIVELHITRVSRTSRKPSPRVR